jgi:3-methylcrotonyl-CoA carboxylase beta subunit
MPTSAIATHVDTASPAYQKNARRMVELVTEIKNQELAMHEGGGAKAIEAQHKKGRLIARERITRLLDHDTRFFELGVYAGYEMYRHDHGTRARLRPLGDDHR